MYITILRWDMAGVKSDDGSTNELLSQRQAHRVSLLFASLIFQSYKKVSCNSWWLGKWPSFL